MTFPVLLKVKLKAGSNGPARRNIKVQKSLNGFDWGPPIPIYYDKVGTGFYFFSPKDGLRMPNQVPGQKYFPVKYNLGKFCGYLGLSVLLYAISLIIKPDLSVLRVGFHTLLLLIFAGTVYLIEKPRLSTITKI